MSHPSGRIVPISPSRRLIGDLLHFARQVPSVPVQRHMRLAGLVRCRRGLPAPVGWCAIFPKAYAGVGAVFPELAPASLGFPFARFYEPPFSIASVAVERTYGGERAVFFAHLHRPEDQALAELDRHLRGFKEEPVESFGLF